MRPRPEVPSFEPRGDHAMKAESTSPAAKVMETLHQVPNLHRRKSRPSLSLDHLSKSLLQPIDRPHRTRRWFRHFTVLVQAHVPISQIERHANEAMLPSVARHARLSDLDPSGQHEMSQVPDISVTDGCEPILRSHQILGIRKLGQEDVTAVEERQRFGAELLVDFGDGGLAGADFGAQAVGVGEHGYGVLRLGEDEGEDVVAEFLGQFQEAHGG